MEIISKKLWNKYILFLIFLSRIIFSQELELANKEEMDIYVELLKTTGENLFIPSPEDVDTLVQNYLGELYESQQQLKEFYKILKTLGYINENNIMELELRTYKEHFFERKEMEIFSEYIRIEWEQDKPKWIIFRSKSSIEPKLNIRNTIFVLPTITFVDNSDHSQKKRYNEPFLQVLATLIYSAGIGEKYSFYFPGKEKDLTEIKTSVQIYDFSIRNVYPRIIDDARLKILTFQYIVYRMRYLDVRIRSIIRNRLKKNISDFYRSIPDSRY